MLTTILALELISSSPADAFELISHKGIHQARSNHDPSHLSQDCPTGAYVWENHSFIENTLPAIREAIKRGADTVEIDLMGTRDGQVILFHDSSLRCRTGIPKLVGELTLAELRNTDLASNYSYHNRADNPLRGRGIGLVTTFQEALDAFPGQRWLINPKEDSDSFLENVGDILANAESRRMINLSQTRMWGSDKAYQFLKKKFPHFGGRMSHITRSLDCLSTYKTFGWMGVALPACQSMSIVVDLYNLGSWNVWGGGLGIVQSLHAQGVKAYLMNANDRSQWAKYWSLGFDGIIASRISPIKD